MDRKHDHTHIIIYCSSFFQYDKLDNEYFLMANGQIPHFHFDYIDRDAKFNSITKGFTIDIRYISGYLTVFDLFLHMEITKRPI